MSEIDPEQGHPTEGDYYLPHLRAAIDAARALQADLDALGVGKPPIAANQEGPRGHPDEAMQLLFSEGAFMPKASVSAGEPPRQLPQQVPEALRYIMWRYDQDHSGEDHRERSRIARAWLEGVSISVMPPGPLVELTPARVAALKVLVALGDSQAPRLAAPARDNIETAVEAVWAMLDEAQVQ